MLRRKLFQIIAILLITTIEAQAGISIWANPENARAQFNIPTGHTKSAEKTRKALRDLDLRQVNEWPDYATVEKAFLIVRDQREYVDLDVPYFLRRITWLYSADGCFQRAGHVALQLKENGFPDVSQFYVFGSDHIKVPWVYHVAVAARVGKDIYIFDPALDPARPALLKEWLKMFTDSSPQMKANICKAGAWDPNTDCSRSEVNVAEKIDGASLAEWRERFQSIERDSLGDEADDLLGQYPPWSNLLGLH